MILGNPPMPFLQAVIEANIFSPLVQLLEHVDVDIKKEAAWAISNATVEGSDEQIRYVFAFSLGVCVHVHVHVRIHVYI